MSDDKPKDDDAPKSENKFAAFASSFGASLKGLVDKAKAEAADPANREKLNGFVKSVTETVQAKAKLAQEEVSKRFAKNKSDQEPPKDTPEKKE